MKYLLSSLLLFIALQTNAFATQWYQYSSSSTPVHGDLTISYSPKGELGNLYGPAVALSTLANRTQSYAANLFAGKVKNEDRSQRCDIKRLISQNQRRAFAVAQKLMRKLDKEGADHNVINAASIYTQSINQLKGSKSCQELIEMSVRDFSTYIDTFVSRYEDSAIKYDLLLTEADLNSPETGTQDCGGGVYGPYGPKLFKPGFHLGPQFNISEITNFNTKSE